MPGRAAAGFLHSVTMDVACKHRGQWGKHTLSFPQVKQTFRHTSVSRSASLSAPPPPSQEKLVHLRLVGAQENVGTLNRVLHTPNNVRKKHGINPHQQDPFVNRTPALNVKVDTKL